MKRYDFELIHVPSEALVAVGIVIQKAEDDVFCDDYNEDCEGCPYCCPCCGECLKEQIDGEDDDNA